MSLNFKEKRALQKTVSEKQAALKSGTLGFKEKREAQKALRDAMAKLGAGTPAPQPAASRPDVSGVKARFTAERVMDVPDGWIVMNAPRPLLGTKTLEGGPFMSGRFYAAIDPADSMAAGFVAENIKLDARVVLQGISTELQIEMALVDNQYADTYRSDFQGDELLDALATQINNLQDKTVAELESIIARAKGGANNNDKPQTYTLKFRNKLLTVLDQDENEVPDYEGFADMLGSKYITFLHGGKRYGEAVLRLSNAARGSEAKAIQEAKELLKLEGDLLDKFKRSKDTSGVDYVIRDASANSNAVTIKPSGFGSVFSDQDVKALREWLEPFGFSVMATTDAMGILRVSARDREFAAAFANHGRVAVDPDSTPTPDPTPEGNESPFQPLINGDLNNLPMPDFVKRLEAAYAEEESLEKAKQAAIGYLEANRAKLEAA